MPVTPFHMGPAMAVKAVMPRYFSIIVFGLMQVAIDLEVLWHLVRGEYPFHTFCHTYSGATIIAAVLTFVGKPTSEWVKAEWNRIAVKCGDANLTVATETTWVASFTGAFIGAYSHILLDSLFHPDIEPLRPWSATNGLGNIVNPHGIEVVCVLLGIVGLTWFVHRERRKRTANIGAG